MGTTFPSSTTSETSTGPEDWELHYDDDEDRSCDYYLDDEGYGSSSSDIGDDHDSWDDRFESDFWSGIRGDPCESDATYSSIGEGRESVCARLTHINEAGEASMVDVGAKAVTERVARARAVVRMRPATLREIVEGNAPKGDVLAVARVAGIQAAKRTSDLIPLCHPLPLSKVAVDFETVKGDTLKITTLCKVSGRTGVEMEAMTAASVAALTVYDMAKGLDKGIVIESIALLEKSGGKSGSWNRDGKA